MGRLLKSCGGGGGGGGAMPDKHVIMLRLIAALLCWPRFNLLKI